MSIEETVNSEKAMFDALQFALNAFMAASSLQVGDDEEKPAGIKNLRVETVDSPSNDEDDWIIVVSYQEPTDNAVNSPAQEDFMDKLSRNRKYYKRIILKQNPLKIVSIDNVK